MATELSAQQSLGEAEKMALQSPDFADRFNQLAESNVGFRGTAGETVFLWVYPVVKIQKVVLKKITQANQYGQIDELADHAVNFPIPVMAQFVGLSTEK